MEVTRSPKPYVIASLAILGLTAGGFVVVFSDKEEPASEHVEVVDDVLNKAVISAVSAVEQTANQTAAQIVEPVAPAPDVGTTVAIPAPSPDPPRREDAVMADPGPDWVAAMPDAPSADAGAPIDEEPLGTLDREVIRDGIKTMRPAVRACYLETLADFPDAEGKVTLAFTISAENDEGRIEMAQLDEETSTLIDEMLHDCMIKALGDLKFPAPDGNGKVNVRYPFNFAASEE